MDKPIFAASTTPDGKRFVCMVGETRSDVWVVENFDPDVETQ